ncbi:RsiV family protein [Nocardia anaemiae]|uniref:RsiV family protein n=1 Tax=Nocardia anaemiae TaxID=263910 RepID=UPI000B2838A6|nr:RsiV family protein [Nocardia anaemiae]
MKKTAAVIGALASAAVLTACGPDESPTTGGGSSASATSAPSVTATSAASTTVAGSPRAETFTATTLHLEGTGYKIDVPQVSGGKTDARTEFNEAMRAGAQEWIDRITRQGDSVTGGDSQVVRIGSQVLSGHLVVIMYSEGAAHPNSNDFAHVTNVNTGKAITLPDLFTDLQQGLNTLSTQAEAQVQQNPRATGYSKSLLTPVAEHFQTWVATPEGMRIYLGEISSHAAGNIDVTVPWSALDSVLEPGMRAVLSS